MATDISSTPGISTDTTIWATYQQARATMEGRIEAASRILQRLRRKRAEAAADVVTRPEVIRLRLRDDRQSARDDVVSMVAAQTADRETLLDAITLARRGPQPVDPLAWERLRLAIDAGRRQSLDSAPEGIVALNRLKEAARVGDQAMVRAGRMMLPDYLAASGQRVDDATLLLFDELETDPEIRTAAALKADAERGTGRMLTSIGLLRVTIEDDHNGYGPYIVDWDGTTHDLSELGKGFDLVA